jgi:DNA (cytosine-5)-methyltransferase 1
MRTLDLFSGIGGITLALHGVGETVAYCEIDPFATRVLRGRMDDGRLPTAPICDDVQRLDADWIRERTGAAGVDAIVGGFPCQVRGAPHCARSVAPRAAGFSRFGLMAGYDHAGSGLFAHIVRLCEALRPSLVFLENVPGIVAMGMDRVRAELGVRCGYELRWCVCSAEQVGAPHLRRRWFCLAVRNDDDARACVRGIAERHPVASADWSWHDPPEPPRMGPDSATRRTRCAALGSGDPAHRRPGG